MLLAKDHPKRILGTGKELILSPDVDFEGEGFVANVVFPNGVVEKGDRLLVYYGASHEYSAVVELSLSDVLGALE